MPSASVVLLWWVVILCFHAGKAGKFAVFLMHTLFISVGSGWMSLPVAQVVFMCIINQPLWVSLHMVPGLNWYLEYFPGIRNNRYLVSVLVTWALLLVPGPGHLILLLTGVENFTQYSWLTCQCTTQLQN